jgi:uncharacterized membrane protein YraQ (UPF0718 family)
VLTSFLYNWHNAAVTSLGLFWMALWAFVLGYLISSMIQVFVSRQRMRRSMGETGTRSVLLGTLFGFISSSCSFSALATTRSLFSKGAGMVPSLAFLLSSTNLVIELGIIIAVFLGWQFVVGEYVGGILLILLMWILVSRTLPHKLEKQAREHARSREDGVDEEDMPDWRILITSTDGWFKVANRYVMEWHMVWRDVTIGFTVAGIIAVFVPREFFELLFVGAGEPDPSFIEILIQTLVGPVAAFLTFIGSMGNIPLAAVLFNNGVSFAGVMAFIFSDLVVLPVLRIQARYYGWKMALYILAIFLTILVVTAIVLHYGFAAFGALPDSAAATNALAERDLFAADYSLVLNLIALGLSVGFIVWKWRVSGLPRNGSKKLSERVLTHLSAVAFAWLGIGALLPLVLALPG